MSADQTVCTQQPCLRPGCRLHAVSSSYVVVACGPLTPLATYGPLTSWLCTAMYSRSSRTPPHYPSDQDGAHPRYCYLDGLLNMNRKENVTVNDRGSERGRSPPAQHVSLASTTCSHMTIPFSPGCRWCASGHGRCGCKWQGRECGWCKGRRCEGCQHRLRGAWGANAGVEGTNGTTRSASVGIDGPGVWWMV